MKIKEAVSIAGTLSKTTKMPGCSFSLPSKACKTGSRLRKQKGTVCSKCYGCKGRYIFSNVKTAQEKRLKGINDPRWVDAMVAMISNSGSDVFRWHDCGDVQSISHLRKIVNVARRLPHISFWIPTKEVKLFNLARKKGIRFPKNLTIRYSAFILGAGPPPKLKNTSTVGSNIGFSCPVSKGTESCNTYNCRACWDKEVKNIDYHLH